VASASDTLTYLVALEEIATVDASVAVMISVHNSLPTQMILRWGTEEQKRRFLEPMARGDMLGGFALSEPEAGSDAASLRTQAVRDGTDWILNGTKAWVSSGTKGDVILAMARTDSPEDRRGARGISAFIITPDLPGYVVGKKEDKMGLRASPTVQLHFTDMRVPGDRLLGQVGSGFIYAMQSLDNGRLGIAAQAIGIARPRCAMQPRTRRNESSSVSRSRNSRRSSSSWPTLRCASRRRGRCFTCPRRPRTAVSA
jgi:alkylation response protein AidB-like acyl-CoA dehydrogenase